MPINHLEAGFGIEIECYLPEGTSAATCAAALTQRGLPCSTQGYNHIRSAGWKLVPDGSLNNYQRGIELVSPVLRGEEGLAQVETACRALTDYGCTISRLCGLHVHVGVGSTLPLPLLKNLTKLYATFEPVLDAIMPPSRRASANTYCRSITSANLAAVDRSTNWNSLLNAVYGNVNTSHRRFHKLNLVAYERHQTVEFRQHSGTLDGGKARKWTELCLRMVAAASNNIHISSQPNVQANRARVGSKAWRVGQMMLRPEGVTAREAIAELNWPTISLVQQARICQLGFTTQRMGREVRYFARATETTAQPAAPITIAGFAETIGASESERQYMEMRAADLGGGVAWAA